MKEIKILILLGLFFLILIPFSSAIIPIKTYDSEKDTIYIKDWIGLVPIVDIQLVSNTYQCLVDCEAIIKISPHTNINLDNLQNYNWKFYDKLSNEKQINWQIYLRKNQSYQIDVSDFGTCQYGNGTEYTCPIGSHEETRYREVWIPFKQQWLGATLIEGRDYYIKLEGKKQISESVDWIPTFRGFKLDEWAWWDSNWTRKKPIDISVSAGSTVQNFQVPINVTYDSDMQSDFGDIKFLNESEDTEFYYWLEEKVDNTWAYFIVNITENITTSNQTIYMYYDNPSASSTSDAVNVFDFYKGFEDGDTGWTDEDNAWNISTDQVKRGIYSEKGIDTSSVADAVFYQNHSLTGEFFWEVDTYVESISGSYLPMGLGVFGSDGTQQDLGAFNETPSVFMVHNSTDYLTIQSFSTGTWYKIGYAVRSTDMDVYVDNFLRNSSMDHGNPASDEGQIRFGHGSGTPEGVVYIDDMRFRKYNNPMPDYWFGSEETSMGVTSILVSPADNTNSSDSTQGFVCNATATGTNLSNITLYIWDSDGSIYYQNTTEISGTSNQTNWTTTLVLDYYKWNCLVYDNTGVYSSWATSNYSLNIIVSVDAESYDNETYETQSSTFQINITLPEEATLYDTKLNYNGTNYTGASVYRSGNFYSLTKTIDIPLLNNTPNGTRIFYWHFVFVGDVGSSHQTSDSHEQNVSQIILTECNSTYQTQAVNFTIKNETGDHSPITNNNFWSVDFNYWVGSGEIYKNYSRINTSTSNPSFAFCIYPNETYYVNMDMEYKSTNHSPRTYYFVNASLTNDTRYIDLYLLNEDDSVKFSIIVLRGYEVISSAYVTISKKVVGENVWLTIGKRKTDSLGTFIEYFDLDKMYMFSVSKNQQLIGVSERASQCTEAPCEMVLQFEDVDTDMWEGYYDVYATNIAYTLSYNSTSNVFTYTYVDLTGLAQYARLQVNQIKYNETGFTVCNESLYSATGTLECNVSSYTGQFSARAYISRSPEKLVDILNAVVNVLKDILGGEGILLSALLIFTVAAAGLWNPVAGVVLATLAFLASIWLGFVTLSYTSLILIIIVGIIIMIKMRA